MSEDATLDEFVEDNSEVEGEFVETAAGQLPVDWDTKNIEELCVLRNGKATNHADVGEQQFLVYGSNGPIGSYSESNFDGGLIFGRVGAVGEVERVREPVWVSDNAIQASVNDRCNTDFLYYYLSSEELSSLATKTAQPLLNQSTIGNVTVPSPLLPEQRKIATVLYTVDRAIEKTEQIISEINTIKDGLIQDLFTDGYFDHDGKHSDQWAKFPTDWELVTVKELIGRGLVEKIMDGNHGERHPTSDDFVTTGTPFVTSNVVKNAQVYWEDCKHLEQHTVDNLRKGFANPGDVLLTHKGHVGRAGKVPESVELAVLSPQVTYYRCGEGINPDFLMYYFLSSHIQKQLQAHSTQTTRDYVGITKQQQLQIALPSLKEQKKIAEVISSVDKRISRETKEKAALQRIKRGLMQDLLSGTVRTTDTNIEVPEEIAQYG